MIKTLLSTLATNTTCTSYGITASTLNEDGQLTLLTTYATTSSSILSNFNNSTTIEINCAEAYIESLSVEELAELTTLADNKISELSENNSIAKIKILK